MLRLILPLSSLSGTAFAETRRESGCLAIPAAFGTLLEPGSLRIRVLGHASYVLETAGGKLALTDCTGFIGGPEVVPDVVTMKIAHDTHFTVDPYPCIP